LVGVYRILAWFLIFVDLSSAGEKDSGTTGKRSEICGDFLLDVMNYDSELGRNFWGLEWGLCEECCELLAERSDDMMFKWCA
jgi:hypothetical protein